MSNESHMINRFFFLSVAFRTDAIHVGDVIVFQKKLTRRSSQRKMKPKKKWMETESLKHGEIVFPKRVLLLVSK